jgi:heme/copper-type cytochrome/quinol oxidase subunit 4
MVQALFGILLITVVIFGVVWLVGAMTLSE